MIALQRLAEAPTTAPLFDTARTTRYLETACEEMIARALRGETPPTFDVPVQCVAPGHDDK